MDILHEKPSNPSGSSIFNTGGRVTQQHSGIGAALNVPFYGTPPSLPASLPFGQQSPLDSGIDSFGRQRNKRSIKKGEGYSPFGPSSPISPTSPVAIAE